MNNPDDIRDRELGEKLGMTPTEGDTKSKLEAQLEEAIGKLSPDKAEKVRAAFKDLVNKNESEISAQQAYIRALDKTRHEKGDLKNVKGQKPIKIREMAIPVEAIIKGITIAAELVPILVGIFKQLSDFYNKHKENQKGRIKDLEKEIEKNGLDTKNADAIRQKLAA